MDYNWIGKTTQKKSIKKHAKSKRKCRMCKKKQLAKKRIFVNTPFSHST